MVIENMLFIFDKLITFLKANFIATFSFLISIIVAGATISQARSLKMSIRFDALSKLVERFESQSYFEKRKSAALACYTNITTKNPGVEVEDILDFFDEIAFLVKKGVLNEDMVWHEFYHWIRLYFQSSIKYITERRVKEPSVWEDLNELMPRLDIIEKNRYPKTFRGELSDVELKEYLEKEV